MTMACFQCQRYMTMRCTDASLEVRGRVPRDLILQVFFEGRLNRPSQFDRLNRCEFHWYAKQLNCANK
jgi:hypothetical protein